MNREEKISRINSFISWCKAANGDSIPDGYTYKDISKIITERYPTQPVEIVKVFFRTKGKTSNNKPYSFHEELPLGTSTMISNDLYDVRTTNTKGFEYGSIPTNKETKKEEVYIDPDFINEKDF